MKTTALFDACQFVSLSCAPPPANAWVEEGAVVLEWMAGDKHLVVGFVGDRVFEYTMFIGDQFAPGQVDDPIVDEIPQDLSDYLDAIRCAASDNDQ